MGEAFKSQYYQTIKLADGVFAFIDTYDRKAGSNSGLIDLGDRVIVFDTFFSPNAARDLRKAAEAMSNGRPITVINSHNHIDHIRGNQFFEDCTIISSETCRTTMKESILATMDEVKAISVSEIEAIKKDFSNETDEMKRTILRYYNSLVKEPMITTLPDLAIRDKLVIYGEKRTVELFSFEMGHSQGDTLMFIPDENIIYTGDLVFNEVHPWLGDGDCNKLKDIHRFIKNFETKYIVPGHGHVGDNNSVDTLIEYIGHMQKIADEAIKTNTDPETAIEDALIAPYIDWAGKPRALDNLRFLCNKPSN